ncbi:DUF1131 family protein [Ferrimonas kyonanensis]|uniref:DUF1131 family protein n=1 Tax=Ferrimonas kyonanensis TaxID=364763 RepID=UPI000400278C|nr:DUF1131 family protein [Ferrimonas kyonanensis]
MSKGNGTKRGRCLLAGISVAALAACAGSELRLTEEGLTGLELSAPTRTQVQRRFPESQVFEEWPLSEAGRHRQLRVVNLQQQELIFHFDDKGLYSLENRQSQIASYLDHRIGDGFEWVYPDGTELCVAGMEALSGRVICPAPGSGHIRYLFDYDWPGPDGELPPKFVLKGATLAAMFWFND